MIIPLIYYIIKFNNTLNLKIFEVKEEKMFFILLLNDIIPGKFHKFNWDFDTKFFRFIYIESETV